VENRSSVFRCRCWSRRMGAVSGRLTWTRRSTVFRNGALRSTAPGPWPGRLRLRGHGPRDLKRPIECADVKRRTRPRQCRSRRQGIREGESAYDIGHIPWGRGGIAAGSLHVTLGVDRLIPQRDESASGEPVAPGPSWPMGSALQPFPAAWPASSTLGSDATTKTR
jgi:hypothetical protein